MRKPRGKANGECPNRQYSILTREVHLADKMTSEQRSATGKEEKHMDIWG